MNRNMLTDKTIHENGLRQTLKIRIEMQWLKELRGSEVCSHSPLQSVLESELMWKYLNCEALQIK